MNVNDAYIAIGLGCIAVAAVGTVVYSILEKWRLGIESRRLHRQFEQKVATAPLPSYDGDTYDWDPGTVRQLLGDPSQTREQPVYNPDLYFAAPVPFDYTAPVPASEMSGPMPVMDTPMETAELAVLDEPEDTFMENLRAENAAFLDSLETR